ncbi:ROK family transcriptional regulator [Kaistia dalseonensis]|uniref:NBD/HSP70 family sugar kinase n=1 Tax=Kaistia dalseonensis TaxID=410840 RepID=A0ABU0H4Z3_9HYPH|nr:ROK family transcriptional regulator [Kaistia dalseonensis]MCX5494797.1 ROK family transcriptional regulator [Kaistia dalseonensis]MDQ0437378.1 putative NBD/HSP70 family sugar kinase [Kaistia dalseonensis]
MKTADPELMRAINRFHVMDAIRRFGPIARVEISDRTELSATTVSAITAALLDDGLIITHQLGGIRDAARGRPRVMLELNPAAAYVVGVKLAPDQITIATTNFRADVLSSLMLPIRLQRQPVSVIADLVEDGIRRCITDAGLTMDQISGVCIGLPGVVERVAGICRASPIFGENDVPFAAELTARLGGVVATIDSDVNLVTLAEHWFGQARGLDDFLVISVELGLGLGIMHNGELFRGANGLSPDLGDLMVRPPSGNGSARLASVASETSILAEARACLTGTEHEHAFRLGRGMEKVVELATTREPHIMALLEHAGEALGFAIANLITLFAPPKVILAGATLAAGDALVEPLRRTVGELLPPSLADVADIVVHHWSDDIWARGAAAMTLRDLYGAPWNTTGPAVHR